MAVNSDLVLTKLKSILSEENFDYATTVITYCETKSLVYNYIGMAEFRDALTHVKRGVNADDEQKIFSEFDSAFEHIRRAAVESMQFYVETKYLDLKRRLKSPFLFLFKAFYTTDWKDIKKTENDIKEFIICARDAKPKTEWQEAIGYFYKADEKIDSLNYIFPTGGEISRRSSKVLLLILMILLGGLIIFKPM